MSELIQQFEYSGRKLEAIYQPAELGWDIKYSDPDGRFWCYTGPLHIEGELVDCVHKPHVKAALSDMVEEISRMEVQNISYAKERSGVGCKPSDSFKIPENRIRTGNLGAVAKEVSDAVHTAADRLIKNNRTWFKWKD